MCDFFPVKKCCADSLSVCPTPRVYTHAHEWSRTHVKDPGVMSEFGGLRKHEKTQYALC